MAEIKSTLDIVMERTRGLQLTDKERKEIKDRELSGKVQALLERFSNDYMGLKWLETELNNLGMQTEPKIREALKYDILERIIPQGLNYELSERLFEVLENVLGIGTDVYRGIIAENDKILAQCKEVFSAKMRSDLNAQGISGPAVIPNITSDPGWTAELEKISEDFRQKIKSA